jgi:hypothetical protein
MLKILTALMILPVMQAQAADCILSDGRYRYLFPEAEELPITIVGYKCSTRQETENELRPVTVITCEGLNPIAMSMYYGKLITYDRVTGDEEVIDGDCDQ